MPGKALLVLQEAAQRREIKGLTKIGIEAIEKSYQVEGEFHIRKIIEATPDSYIEDIIQIEVNLNKFQNF